MVASTRVLVGSFPESLNRYSPLPGKGPITQLISSHRLVTAQIELTFSYQDILFK